jgi:hypothetical protein
MQRYCRLKLSLAIALCFAAVGSIPVAAADDGSPPPTGSDGVAAASQYRESVPTASGKVSSTAVNSRPETLTPRVQAAIRAGGGRDKKLLKSVGGSAALRVPDNGLKRAVDRSTAKQPDALGAALGTPSSSWGTIALFVVLIGGTLFAAAATRPLQTRSTESS